MPLVRKREAAKRDLIQQWLWYAEQADLETADRFLQVVEKTALTLASQPEAGYRFFVRSVALQGMRRLPLNDGFEKTLLFYFPLRDGIDLVRVIHGSQDVNRLLLEGFLS